MTELLIILAFTIAGLIWTLGGYLAAYRKRATNPDWNGFEPKKLRDDAILGTILGIGAYIYGVYLGQLPDVSTFQAFIGAVVGGLTVVPLVDKFIVAGLFNK